MARRSASERRQSERGLPSAILPTGAAMMALGLAPERHQSEQDLPTEVEPVGRISRIDNQNIRPVGRISLRMPNMSNANADNDPIQRRLRQVEESLRRAHSILDQPRQAAEARARV